MLMKNILTCYLCVVFATKMHKKQQRNVEGVLQRRHSSPRGFTTVYRRNWETGTVNIQYFWLSNPLNNECRDEDIFKCLLCWPKCQYTESSKANKTGYRPHRKKAVAWKWFHVISFIQTITSWSSQGVIRGAQGGEDDYVVLVGCNAV